MKITLLAAVGSVFLLIVSGCFLSGHYGPVVRNYDRTFDACGLSVRPPQTPGLSYLEPSVNRGIYSTICEIFYRAKRADYLEPFYFDLKYAHAELFWVEGLDMSECLLQHFHDTVDNDLFRLVEVEFDEVEYLGDTAIRFKTLRVGNYTGHQSFEFFKTGYAFPHPDNEHWIVIISYSDVYRPSKGEPPDERMRQIGEAFLHGVERIPLTEAEKTSEARDRVLRSWIN